MNFAETILSEDSIPGNSPALRIKDQVISRAELIQRVESLSSYFQKQGIQPGSLVCLQGENSFAWVVSYLALMRSGLVCVPLPADSSAEKIRAVVKLAEPKLFLVSDLVAGRNAQALESLGVPVQRLEALFVQSNSKTSTEPAADVLDTDPALILFTSGSTGDPKGVVISHGNLLANTQAILQAAPILPSDVVMNVLPFCYSFGASILHTHLKAGACIVINNQFMFADRVLEEMVKVPCTGFAGVPSTFQILLKNSSLKKKPPIPLRYLLQAGGKLAQADILELEPVFPGALIYVMYGQTEATARLTILPPEELKNKLGSAGKAIPGVKIRILPDDDAPSGYGEVTAQGANISQGYYRDEARTTQVFSDGWLHTGDLGRLDEDGYLFLQGRKSDILKCAGNRASALDVETAMRKFETVKECAVVAMPDELLGEAVAAFVCVQEGFVMEQFLEYLKKALPPYLQPKKVQILEALPKTGSGKVLKGELRKQVTDF